MIGIFWLLLATIMIFLKFGAFIFFLIACSCAFSLVSFAAAMSAIGPEGEKGDIIAIYKKCRRKCAGGSEEQKESLVVQQQQHQTLTSVDSETTPDAPVR